MTDTDTGGALLRAILDNPECDTARLVYADYLQGEGGDERAEFIRVQVAIAAYDTVPMRDIPDGALDALLERQSQVWESANDWFPSWESDPFFPHRATIQQSYYWRWQEDTIRSGVTEGFYARAALVRRGLIESVTCPAHVWLTHCTDILARHPVRKVRLTTGLDWWGGANDEVILQPIPTMRIRGVRYTCRNIKYGQWWGGFGTVLEHITAAEWPGIAFESPPDLYP